MATLYLRTDRWYTYKETRVKVIRGVFHPGLFFSTGLLLDYLSRHQLSNKTFLELGAGTGLISIVAHKHGATVTASDKSRIAIKNLEINFKEKGINAGIINSDLFDAIPPHQFDFIVINPPYYKKDPATEEQLAWYCGENHEYFQKLFSTLIRYINNQSHAIMVLSEDCDIQRIKEIANLNGFEFHLKYTRRKLLEKNFIFEIYPTQPAIKLA